MAQYKYGHKWIHCKITTTTTAKEWKKHQTICAFHAASYVCLSAFLAISVIIVVVVVVEIQMNSNVLHAYLLWRRTRLTRANSIRQSLKNSLLKAIDLISSSSKNNINRQQQQQINSSNVAYVLQNNDWEWNDCSRDRWMQQKCSMGTFFFKNFFLIS